ncbi:PREDICTED: multidrug resistance-associated protein 1-like [Rhagoletis zephyria]|uniref:multidrug resistance-associated protein 1-like n=1 Tax=Rhagoletis zephyria TaxID=28612 RepID=UPI00081188C2|nr:PREDICTED: multidrug resistance-associated protein 1-like [Rhagoletis zephyria]
MNLVNTSKEVLNNFEQKLDTIRTEKIIKKMKTEAYSGYQHSEAEKRSVQINVAIVIIKVYWMQLLGIAMLKFVASCLTFGNPVILDFLMTFMSDTSGSQPTWRGFLFAAMMFVFPLFESVINSQHDYWMNILILRIRTCMISMIYNKSLRLSTYGRRNYSTGEIVNIMSVDSQRLTDFLLWANSIWAAPLQFGIAIYLLWQQVGWASMAGLIFMFILLPFNGWISARIRNNQMKVMKEKDKRTKLMNEILNGMKVLKLYAWENSFKDKIQSLRDYECKELYNIAYLSGFMFFAFSAAPFLVGLLTFALYVLSGNVLDPNKAFVSLSLFNIIRVPMGMLPMLLSMGAMCLVSIRRLNNYLNSEELDEDAIRYMPDQECAIRVKDGTFTWHRNGTASLKDINLEVPHGKLVAMVGSVGSGKSSLLSGVLGDMEKIGGSVNVDGRIAFVPQQAWVQNATLRKNVTFTNAFDEKRYKKVIKACCMEPDINILADGDQTEIGERGINLSGGQKQRISLARAVYADAQIYLLDDPLSAVDAHVGKKLFADVIGNKGLLRNKTRLLATHRISVLSECDEIIVLKDGGISERGTMDQLIEEKGDFAEFLAEYLVENMDNSGDDSEDNELMKSLAEKVKPILERSESLRSKGSLTRSDSVRSSLGRPAGGIARQQSQTSVRRRRESSSAKEASKEMSKEQQLKKKGGPGEEKVGGKGKGKGAGKLITEESAATGSVKLKVYIKYFQTVGTAITALIIGSMVVSNVFQIFSSLWLSSWSNDGLDPVKANDTDLRNWRLGGYAGFGAGEIVASLFSTIVLNIACIRASKLLHNEMLACIMFAPMAFFDTTPIGRILNRFTKDVDVADSSMVFNLRMGIMQFFRTIVAFLMISLEAPIILAAIAPIIILYYIIQRVYIASSRQLKRIESTTRSPIYNHFAETVNGASSIRAYGVQERFIADSNNRIDHNNTCFYASITASRWLSIRLEFFGYTIVFLAAIFAVLSRGTVTPGMAGLAISYSLNITGVLGMFVRAATDLETNIVSIERLIEYSEVESEAAYYREEKRPPSGKWPKAGEIKFEKYSTRYRPGLDLVVKDVNFSIRSQEKVGIVGRTGAGKSSLTLALFRIIEPSGGKIVIDEVDVGQLGLYDLRSRITIIPQDPVLFTGSLRMNLDPFEVYSDEEIWRSLELAHLKDFVQSVENQLLYKITEGGENLSVGQRQLVCLARALLRKSKILVLDEATAAVDMETDGLIQETIRAEFADCTIVTIAHRLNTVIDYDRILVLDQGRVIEYDTPSSLLAKKTSTFYSMAKDAKLV